jgi:inward rectifier potassium channel
MSEAQDRSEQDRQELYRRATLTRIGRTGPGRRNFVVRGGPTDGWRDLYHHLLTMPWWAFVATTAAVYLGVNLLFALLYWPDTGRGLQNGTPGRFADAFNFSVETLGTIGYGVLAPRDAYVNALVTAEAFTSIFLTAVLTGLIFSRVSRPTARVLFSEVAVIADFEGKPTLMFRAANQRANQILEAEATLTLARRLITQEGVMIRVFEEMNLRRSRSPLFAISWTVMHPIDETSPIFGLDEAALREIGAEFLVTIAGVDETSSQRVHARHSYVTDEIVFGRQFADVVTPLDDGTGRWMIDYRKFHDVRPAGAGEAAPLSPDRPADARAEEPA